MQRWKETLLCLLYRSRARWTSLLFSASLGGDLGRCSCNRGSCEGARGSIAVCGLVPVLAAWCHAMRLRWTKLYLLATCSLARPVSVVPHIPSVASHWGHGGSSHLRRLCCLLFGQTHKLLPPPVHLSKMCRKPRIGLRIFIAILDGTILKERGIVSNRNIKKGW